MDPSHDPSVFDEPHMRGVGGSRVACWKCGYDRTGLKGVCPECGAAEYQGGPDAPAAPGVPPAGPVLGADGAEVAEQSVWEEPTLASKLAGPAPADAATYAKWLTRRCANTPLAATWAATILCAAAAGPWAVIGTFCGAYGGTPTSTGGMSAVGLLAIVLVGPVMEEVMKVAAATWAVERRPYLFVSAGQVALCCAAGGVVFAVIENILYLNVYVPNPTPELRRWRWTVCVALHSACSLIAGLGLMKVWRNTIETGKRPDLGLGVRHLTAAIATHGVYNAGAVWMG